jgi:hypothetical protein
MVAVGLSVALIDGVFDTGAADGRSGAARADGPGVAGVAGVAEVADVPAGAEGGSLAAVTRLILLRRDARRLTASRTSRAWPNATRVTDCHAQERAGRRQHPNRTDAARTRKDEFPLVKEARAGDKCGLTMRSLSHWFRSRSASFSPARRESEGSAAASNDTKLAVVQSLQDGAGSGVYIVEPERAHNEPQITQASDARKAMNPLFEQVTLVVYGWKNVEPGTLSWVFPSVSAAVAAARAMTNAVKWAIVAGKRDAVGGRRGPRPRRGPHRTGGLSPGGVTARRGPSQARSRTTAIP